MSSNFFMFIAPLNTCAAFIHAGKKLQLTWKIVRSIDWIANHSTNCCTCEGTGNANKASEACTPTAKPAETAAAQAVSERRLSLV